MQIHPLWLEPDAKGTILKPDPWDKKPFSFPPRLRELAQQHLGQPSPDRIAQGRRRLQSTMKRRPRRHLWVFAFGLTALLATWISRRQSDTPPISYQVEHGRVDRDGRLLMSTASNAIVISFAATKTRVKVAPFAHARMTTGPGLALDDGNMDIAIEPSSTHAFVVEAGPFSVSLSQGTARVQWTAFILIVDVTGGFGIVRGPLLPRRQLSAGTRLVVDLPRYAVTMTPPQLANLAAPLPVTSASTIAAVTVKVDFGHSTGAPQPGWVFGLNTVGLLNSRVGAPDRNRRYLTPLSALHLSFIRLGVEVTDSATHDRGWVQNPDTADYRWDRKKIARTFEEGLSSRPLTMVNIPVWPAYLGDQGKPLDPSQEPAFITFCADLVRVLNTELGQKIELFEVFDELEGAYQDQGERQGALFVKIARAMKSIDPSIKVGGPGFTHPWHKSVVPFIKTAAPELGFFSYHFWGAHDLGATPTGLFDAAESFGAPGVHLKNLLARHVPHPVDLFLTRYNVTWRAPNAYMEGPVGAVFDALAMSALAQSPLTGAAAWCDYDGWYGKFDQDFALRPSAHVARIFNDAFVGTPTFATSDAPQTIAAFAVASDRKRSILLTNRGNSPVTLVLLVDTPLTAVTLSTVTQDGLHEDPLPLGLPATLTLPPVSVTVIRGDAN